MKIKTLGIAPYQGLKERLEELGKDDHELDLHVVYGNLQDGVEAAVGAEKEGYEIILSRGGTAKLIKEHVSIPVVDIQVSGYDVLRVLTLVKDYGGKVAILGFPSISNGAAAICDLLEIEIETFTIYNENEVKDMLNEMKKKGFDVVIGDVVTVETARTLGLQEILLTSGTESIKEAFRNVKEMYRFFHHLTKERYLFKYVLNHSNQGILILNNQNHILHMNSIAEKYLNNQKNLLTKLSFQTFLHKIREQKKADSVLFKMDDKVYPTSGVQITASEETYTILYIDPPLKENNQQGILIKEPVASDNVNPFSRITGSSKVIVETIEKAQSLSRTEIPIWISGESGTGKETFAHAIHHLSHRHSHSLVQLDAAILSPNKWEDILFGSDKRQSLFESAGRGTVYIKNIEQLPQEAGRPLISYLQSQTRPTPRIIVSSSKSVIHKVQKEKFLKTLYSMLAMAKIDLPPLRERMEDIEDLTRLFIARFNSRYGKEIVGLHQDLLNELKSFSWPSNVRQLNQLIERFVLQSPGPFIRKEDVQSILEESKETEYPLGADKIDWNGTLAEIEKRIIKMVLHEEGMNQSKAAQRLGINRTTLWRKLK